jgi:hypothetical protein
VVIFAWLQPELGTCAAIILRDDVCLDDAREIVRSFGGSMAGASLTHDIQSWHWKPSPGTIAPTAEAIARDVGRLVPPVRRVRRFANGHQILRSDRARLLCDRNCGRSAVFCEYAGVACFCFCKRHWNEPGPSGTSPRDRAHRAPPGAAPGDVVAEPKGG